MEDDVVAVVSTCRCRSIPTVPHGSAWVRRTWNRRRTSRRRRRPASCRRRPRPTCCGCSTFVWTTCCPATAMPRPPTGSRPWKVGPFFFFNSITSGHQKGSKNEDNHPQFKIRYQDPSQMHRAVSKFLFLRWKRKQNTISRWVVIRLYFEWLGWLMKLRQSDAKKFKLISLKEEIPSQNWLTRRHDLMIKSNPYVDQWIIFPQVLAGIFHSMSFSKSLIINVFFASKFGKQRGCRFQLDLRVFNSIQCNWVSKDSCVNQ